MKPKEEFPQIEAQDLMRQAFNELFGPLLNGESIFIEINSRVPTTNMGPLFTKIMLWGLGNSLVVDPIDIAMSRGKDLQETGQEKTDFVIGKTFLSFRERELPYLAKAFFRLSVSKESSRNHY